MHKDILVVNLQFKHTANYISLCVLGLHYCLIHFIERERELCVDIVV